MQQQFIDLISQYNKISVEAAKGLIGINVKAFEKCAQSQTELMNDYIEVGMKQIEATREIKDIKDVSSFLSNQSTEMTKYAEKFYACAKENVDTFVATSDELNDWIKKGMNTAASNLKPVSTKKAA